MAGRGGSVHQTSYQFLCDTLSAVARRAVESHRGDRSAIGSVPLRAVVTLYMVLLSHPVDRRGRCRSCRRPGELFGLQRRRCRVQRTAHFYLHHPDDALLLSHLARELDLPTPTTPQAPVVSLMRRGAA